MNEPIARSGFLALVCRATLVLVVALAGATNSMAGPEDNFPPGGNFPAGWTTSPGADAGWVVATDSANGGVFSLRPVVIIDEQTASVQVGGNFSAGTISFAYQVSSEECCDYLQFFIDGVEQFAEQRSGEIPWTTVSFPVTAGSHIFKWSYVKDDSFFAGADRAWIDTVVLPPPSTLADDNFPPGGQMPAGWTTAPGANAGWIVASDSANRGPFSLKSATISHNQSAAIQFAGTFVAGSVTFAYSVSSEGGFDFLQFYIDGVAQFTGDAVAGEIPWTQASFPITAGAHTLRWAYTKDVSVSEGEDAAWIDTVVLPTGLANTSTAITQHTPNPSAVGAPIAVMASVTVTPPGSGTPTGTVTVSDGSANCVITLPATGCNLTPTSAGMKTLIATYSGNATFNGSTSPGVGHTVTGGTGTPPTLQSAVSRRVHAAAGTFDLPLSLVTSNPTSEPRLGPAATVVLTFDKAITGATATVTAGTATAGAPSFSGNAVIVPLTGVADLQYVTVSLTNVTASDGGTGGSGSVRIGFLAGDVNGSRLVNSTDILTVKSGSGETASALNFKSDLNASGLINSTDILTVKASSGHALPTP